MEKMRVTIEPVWFYLFSLLSGNVLCNRKRSGIDLVRIILFEIVKPGVSSPTSFGYGYSGIGIYYIGTFLQPSRAHKGPNSQLKGLTKWEKKNDNGTGLKK